MIESILQSLWTTFKANFKIFLEEDLPKLIVATLIMIAATLLSRYAVSLVDKALKRSKADKGVSILLKNLTRWTVIGTGIFISISLFVNVSSLITTLGLATFAITFAFQDVLKNLVSGIIILVQHPFNVGESVNISGFEGVVVSITTRMTEMECFDGRFVAIPNGNAISQPIINYSRSPKRRAELPMKFSYDINIARVRDLITTAVKMVPGYLDDPAPMVTLDNADAISLWLTVYYWVDMTIAESMLKVKDTGYETITKALVENGIEIPVTINRL